MFPIELGQKQKKSQMASHLKCVKRVNDIGNGNDEEIYILRTNVNFKFYEIFESI